MNREAGGIAEEEKGSVRGEGQAGWKGASFPLAPTPLGPSRYLIRILLLLAFEGPDTLTKYKPGFTPFKL